MLEGVQAFPEGGPVLTVEPFAQRVGQGLADLAVGPCVGLVAKRLELARGIVAAGGGLTVRALMHGDAPALRVEDLDLEGAEADDDLTSRVGVFCQIEVVQNGVSIQSEKAAGFSPVERKDPPPLLFGFYPIRAWVRLYDSPSNLIILP